MAKNSAPNAPAAPAGVLTEREEYQAFRHPRYVAADAKLQEIKARRDELDRQIQAEHSRIAAFQRAARHQAEAHALVHGDDLAAEAPMEDLARLQHDLAVHRQAVEIAEEHREAVRREVSAEICDRVRPAYLETVRKVYERARDLEAIREEYRRFIAGLEDHGTILINLPLIGAVSPSEMEDLARHHGISLN